MNVSRNKFSQTTCIMAWNANGLLARKLELTEFLKTEKVEIALISETHLTSRNKADIRGYDFYQCNHPSGASHGGSAIYVRNTLRHHACQNFCTDKIQATIITVCLHNGSYAKIAAIYSPPKHGITTLEYDALFDTLGTKWLAGGDFNAKHQLWGSRLRTTKGKHLYDSITARGLQCHSNGQPTYWPTDPAKKPDCIDFFISKNISSNYIQLTNIADLTSDHSPILLMLSDTIITKAKRPQLTNKFTDWELFRELVTEKLNLRVRIKTKTDVDRAIEQLQTILIDAAQQATPTSKPVPVARSYPRDILELIQSKRAARHRWQRTRDPTDKSRLNALNRKVKDLITKINNETFNDFILSLDTTAETDYSLWRVAKATRVPKAYNPPLRVNDTLYAHSDAEKAEAFATHLEKVFQPNDIHSDVTPTIHNTDGPTIKLVTPKEIARTVKSMKKRKAPGLDLITNNIIAQCPKKVYVLLTYIYNASIRLSYFPRIWKKAKIILIPKPGKPVNELTSYRPISLLSTLSKIYEKLLHPRLLTIIEDLGIVPSQQFGFRAKHATVEQIHRVTTKIRNALEGKEYCPAVFLDVKQAFDRMWIQGLLHKVSEYLPRAYVKLLRSYLTDRTFEVHHGEAASTSKPISAGVPQGSVLGPLLYVLYTADIPMTKSTDLATFADDTALITSHENHDTATTQLQRAVSKVAEWMRKWKIQINTEKSVYVMFTLRNCPPTIITVNHTNLLPTPHAKYLGLTLDSKLNWRTHILKKREELKIRFRDLFWMFQASNKLSLSNKRLLYVTILRPLWSYAAPIWGIAAKANINILQRQQNLILRRITGAPWFLTNQCLHQDLNIPTVKETIQHLTISYEKRLHQHVNTLAIRLLEEPALRRLQRRHFLELSCLVTD